MHILPDEILAHIFVLTKEETPNHTVESTSEFRPDRLEYDDYVGHNVDIPVPGCPEEPPEVTVSHVSRRWRRIANGHPFLWTRVTDYIDALKPSSRLAVYLERSGQLLVDVSLRFEDTDMQDEVCGENRADPTDYKEVDDAMTLIVNAAARLQRLELWTHTCPGVLAQMTRHLRKVHAPHLERFLLQYKGRNDLGGTTTRLFQGGAPCLHHLLLYGHDASTKLRIFASITRLVILSGPVGSRWQWDTGVFCGIVASCPQLLELVTDTDHLSCIEDGDTLASPSLNHLWISNQAGHATNSWLSPLCPALKTPALTQLTLWSFHGAQFVIICNTLDLTNSDIRPFNLVETVNVVHSNHGELIRSESPFSRDDDEECYQHVQYIFPPGPKAAFPQLQNLNILGTCYFHFALLALLSVEVDLNLDLTNFFRERTFGLPPVAPYPSRQAVLPRLRSLTFGLLGDDERYPAGAAVFKRISERADAGFPLAEVKTTADLLEGHAGDEELAVETIDDIDSLWKSFDLRVI